MFIGPIRTGRGCLGISHYITAFIAASRLGISCWLHSQDLETWEYSGTASLSLPREVRDSGLGGGPSLPELVQMGAFPEERGAEEGCLYSSPAAVRRSV